MANTTIKITQLQNIGNGLAGNTLLPVVNTTGTAITQKVTVGNVANFIMGQAGNTLSPAFLSTLAYSVVNAAQPNITSVGTLSINTLKISGGTNGYVIQTDGSGNLSWTAQTGNAGNGTPGGSNTQVQFNDSGAFGGNTGFTFNKTTGIFTSPFLAGNGNGLSNIQGANVSGLGNIATANFDGNTSNVLHGDGTWSADQTTYGNSNVVTLLSAFGSNTITTTGNISGGNLVTGGQVVASGNVSSGTGLTTGGFLSVDGNTDLHNTIVTGNLSATGNITASYVLGNGSQLTNIAGANVSGFVPNANVANTAFAVAAANVIGLGNIATLSLSGSTSNVLYGNGIFAPVNVGNLSQISNGNSNVTLTDTNSNVYINTNGGTQKQWIFDTVGNLRTPGNVDIYGAINFPQQVSNINWSTYNIELSQYGRITTNVDFFANANVIGAQYLKGDGSNISNIAVANIVGLGNIATISLTGSTSNVLFGNGTFAAVPAPTVSQDITSNGAMSIMTYDGNLKYVSYATVEPSTGNIAGGNISATGNITANNLGNISSINIDGSNTNVLYGNGVFAAVAGGNANTGNVTFNDINIIGTGNLKLQPDSANANAYLDIFLTAGPDIHIAGNGETVILGTDNFANVAVNVNGNVSIQAGDANGTHTWIFDTTGDINIPPNAASFGTGRIQSANGYPTLLAYGSGSHGGPELTWADTDDVNDLGNANVLRNTMYINESGLWVGMNENLVANTFAGTWNFTPNGTIIFPTLEVDLHNGGVQTGQVLQFGNSSQQAIITGPTPSANVDAQRIIIQGQRGNGELSEGGDVYVWAGDADTNGGDIKIYAGNADNVAAGTGGYVNIDGGDGFDNGGGITLTGGISANGYGGTVNITGGSGELGGGAASLQGGYGGNGQGGAVQIVGGGGNSQASYGNVEIGSGTYNWLFDNSGNLTLPTSGHIIVSGGIVGGGASPAPYISGFDSIGALEFTNGNSNVTVTANTSSWTFGTNGNLTLPEGGIVTNNIPPVTFDILYQYDDLEWDGITVTFTNASSTYMLGVLALMQAGDPITLVGPGGPISTTVAIPYTGGSAGYFTVTEANSPIQITQFTLPNRLTSVNGVTLTTNAKNYLFTEAGVTQSPVLTVDTLPSGQYAVAGFRAFVSDANLAPVGNFGAIVGNSGSNTVCVWCDGTNWRIG